MNQIISDIQKRWDSFVEEIRRIEKEYGHHRQAEASTMSIEQRQTTIYWRMDKPGYPKTEKITCCCKKLEKAVNSYILRPRFVMYPILGEDHKNYLDYDTSVQIGEVKTGIGTNKCPFCGSPIVAVEEKEGVRLRP